MINKIQIKISFGANWLDVFINWTLASFSYPDQLKTALSFLRRNKNKKQVKDYYEGLISYCVPCSVSFTCIVSKITLWGGDSDSNCRIRTFEIKCLTFQCYATIEIGRILTQYMSCLIPKAKFFSMHHVNYQKTDMWN